MSNYDKEQLDDLVNWYKRVLADEKQTRIDLSRLNAKLIAKLEKKNSKQKKRIAHLEEENLKWIGAFAGYGKTINELREENIEAGKWKKQYWDLWESEYGYK